MPAFELWLQFLLWMYCPGALATKRRTSPSAESQSQGNCSLEATMMMTAIMTEKTGTRYSFRYSGFYCLWEYLAKPLKRFGGAGRDRTDA